MPISFIDPEQKMTTKAVINKVLENAKTYTKNYLDAMPADGYDFKPIPEIRSFAQQMLHLADATYYFICIASGKPSPIGQVSAEQTVSPSKEATKKTVLDSYDFFAEAVNQMTDEQLQETVKYGKLEVPKSAMIIKAYEHQAHHRGQAAIYLRLRGVVPSDGIIF